jgi:hypothetical protein
LLIGDSIERPRPNKNLELRMSVPNRPFLIAALLLITLSFSLAAQSGDPAEIPAEPDWFEEDLDIYAKGDKIFSMSLGIIFPTLFLDNHGSRYEGNVKIGGTGSLAFFYYLSSHWFIGGEIQGMFAPTFGGNMIYIIPMGVRGGYQFVVGRFEFPLTFMVGMAPITYIDTNYLGLFLKPEVSAYWRLNDSWSFGLNTGWWFVPQWPKDLPEYNRYANFLELTLSARYHF